jgi:hypothetical protein
MYSSVDPYEAANTTHILTCILMNKALGFSETPHHVKARRPFKTHNKTKFVVMQESKYRLH